MEIVIASSARKHGISKKRILRLLADHDESRHANSIPPLTPHREHHMTAQRRSPSGANSTDPTEIDLESVEIRDSQGRRIDESYVDEVVAYAHDVLARPVGRPSLTGASEHSPQVSFRVTPAMKEAAARLAAERGMSVSELARRALDDLIVREGHSNRGAG